MPVPFPWIKNPHHWIDKGDTVIGLAPMEGVSDFPFRRWVSLCSTASYHSTPFLRVTDTFPHKDLPVDFAPEILDSDYKDRIETPVVLQVMGPSPERIIKAGKLILDHTNYFDINFGCPAPTVVGRGSGSALLSNPDNFKNFVSEIYENLPENSFSIKIRTGYEDDSNYESIINSIEHMNLKRLTIHGRTKVEKYMGFANWDHIELAAKKLQIPVVGSGDVSNKKTYEERLSKAPSISGVIIGRAAQKNPWIFDSIKAESPKTVSFEQILNCALVYGCYIEVFFGRGYEEFKKIDLELGMIQKPLSEKEWEQYLKSFAMKAFATDKIEDMPIERRALSRIKMIWTHMKDILPEEFHDRTLLRAKTCKDFIEAFRIAQKSSIERTGQNEISVH